MAVEPILGVNKLNRAAELHPKITSREEVLTLVIASWGQRAVFCKYPKALYKQGKGVCRLGSPPSHRAEPHWLPAEPALDW